MLSSTVFVACSDDDGEDEPYTPQVVNMGKRLGIRCHYLSDGTEKRTYYGYDESGRLYKVGDSLYFHDVKETYKWDGNSMTIAPYGFNILDYRPCSVLCTFKNNRLQTTVSLLDTCTYVYSKDGNLILMRDKSFDHGCFEARIYYDGDRISRISRTVSYLSGDASTVDYFYSYDGQTCNGVGNLDLIQMIVPSWGFVEQVFFVHPELVGLRKMQLPSMRTWKIRMKEEIDPEEYGCKWKYTLYSYELAFKWTVDADKYVMGYTSYLKRNISVTVSNSDDGGYEMNSVKKRVVLDTWEDLERKDSVAFLWE